MELEAGKQQRCLQATETLTMALLRKRKHVLSNYLVFFNTAPTSQLWRLHAKDPAGASGCAVSASSLEYDEITVRQHRH